MRRIHITGASGSGTTTLGKKLAEILEMDFYDSDDFFWEKTDPPYQIIRKRKERFQLMEEKLSATNWVLSGSITCWAEIFESYFDLVIFLYLPQKIRIERLHKREIEEFGLERMKPNGDMHENYQKFIKWAASYDTGGMNMRSLKSHNYWLENLTCPIIRIEGNIQLKEKIDLILKKIRSEHLTS